MLKRVQTVLRRDVLLFVVFATGLVVLAVEILAVRILAPFFGNTIFSFSSIISVILAALSVGYWYGGRLADKRPEQGFFFTLVLWSGIAVLIVHALGTLLLPLMATVFPITYGPLIAAVVLFFVPAFIFGLLSPFVIKLRSVQLSERGVGTISGEVFFWSTFGSIAGSLLSGFYLVPFVGVSTSMTILGSVTALIGLVGVVACQKKRKVLPIFPLIVGVTLSIMTAQTNMPSFLNIANAEVLYSEDGLYEKISVLDMSWYGTPARVLLLDRSFSSATSVPGGQPLFGYAQYWQLYEYFDDELERALVLGAGAGSVATGLYHQYPEAIIDVVDIEPKLYEVAYDYFLMPRDERLQTHVADGRQFVRTSDNVYDLVFADMYSTYFSVPWHVSTREHYQLVYNRMRDGGMYVGNYIAALDQTPPSLLGAHMRTMAEVFDAVYVFAVESAQKTTVQNIVLVGTKGDTEEITREGLRTHDDAGVSQFWAHLVPFNKQALQRHPPFTDELAPIELYTAELLLRSDI